MRWAAGRNPFYCTPPQRGQVGTQVARGDHLNDVCLVVRAPLRSPHAVLSKRGSVASLLEDFKDWHIVRQPDKALEKRIPLG